MSVGVGIGTDAPDFELAGTLDGDRATFRLSDYRGQPVLLVFYPADNSMVCTRQLVSYSADVGTFADIGAQVLALSPQTVDSHEAFASSDGPFGFPLLADVDKEVGERYDILGPLGFYRRSVFVVDRGGVVRYRHRAMSGLGFRPVSELIDAVQAV